MKKVLAILALVAVVAVASVASAQDSTVTATIGAASAFDASGCATMTDLTLDPVDGSPGAGNATLGYDWDTQTCNLTVASNGAGWTLAQGEENGTPGALDTAYEADMGHTQAVVGHPDVIIDCTPATACNLSDVTMPTYSEWGLWYGGAATTPGADVDTCTASTSGCALTLAAQSIVSSGSATTGGTAENLDMNIDAVVNYTTSASGNYTDGVTFTFVSA
ncbi:hypothetical protein ACFL10_00020 [Patescibacteria group bacterium]